jgi:membrane protease YdiL (CAAX protease family)
MQPEDLQDLNEVTAPPVEPPAERVPFWGYVDLLQLTVLSFLVMLGASAVAYFYPKLILIIQLVAYAAIYFCFLAVFKMKYDRDVFNSLGWRQTRYSLFAAGLGGVLLAFGLATVASLIHTPKVKTPFDDLINTPVSFALLSVIAVVFAPLSEEMFFRGFCQPLLSRTLGAAFGVLVTAVLFGSLHGAEYQWAWQYVAAITTVGIALGVVRAKTDSIIPGTVMHGCFNAVSVVGLLAAKYITHK